MKVVIFYFMASSNNNGEDLVAAAAVAAIATVGAWFVLQFLDERLRDGRPGYGHRLYQWLWP